MVAKVVGVQSVDFTDDKGSVIQGAKIHFVRDLSPDETDRVIGQVADTLFIRSSSPLLALVKGLKIGQLYDFVYECFGRRKASLVDIKSVG